MNGDEILKTLKWLAICFLLACVTSVAISGSLADDTADDKYLTIVQLKLQRSGNGFSSITARDLLPITEDPLNKEDVTLSEELSLIDKDGNTKSVNFTFDEEMYISENALDYIVAVTNTGNVTGYVRTWFAFEMGDLTAEEFEASVLLNRDIIEWTWTDFEYGVMIEGQRYAVICAEYKGASEDENKDENEGELKAGETTAPSLLQILLQNGVDNEIVKRIDGDYDFNYDVLVHSQAVSHKGAWGANGKPWNME